MNAEKVKILAIESSCDDTAAAVSENNKILANVISSQKVHKKYGGVVPELASRAHEKNIIPVVDQAIEKAGIRKNEINAVAFTQGPGLLGSLLVGGTFAKSFALAMDVPLVTVNHMQGHVLAHFIEDSNPEGSSPEFPFLCLTVSGGHTQIVLVKDHLDMEIIGQTRDDAAGEAFDKSAKILGLPYPGGPMIDKFAKAGNPKAFDFPEPQIPELDFSFSGLKTAILYFVQDRQKENPDFVEKNMADICASIQHRIVTILMNKLKKAAAQTGITHIAIAGGVSANSELRAAVRAEKENSDWSVYIPKFEYCTDNAAMIAIGAYYQYLDGRFADQSVAATARMPF